MYNKSSKLTALFSPLDNSAAVQKLLSFKYVLFQIKDKLLPNNLHYLRKLLTGLVNSTSLSHINFRVFSRQTKTNFPFDVLFSSTNYLLHFPFQHVLSHYLQMRTLRFSFCVFKLYFNIKLLAISYIIHFIYSIYSC